MLPGQLEAPTMGAAYGSGQGGQAQSPRMQPNQHNASRRLYLWTQTHALSKATSKQHTGTGAAYNLRPSYNTTERTSHLVARPQRLLALMRMQRNDPLIVFSA